MSRPLIPAPLREAGAGWARVLRRLSLVPFAVTVLVPSFIIVAPMVWLVRRFHASAP